MEKFKKDPYNLNNHLITEDDIINIMKTLNINDFKINNLSYYQTSFIHKSYCMLSEYGRRQFVISQPHDCSSNSRRIFRC